MEEFFNQIEKILQEKKLEAQVAINEAALVDDRRFLVIPCQDKDGKKWLFKIQYLAWSGLQKNFVNEVNFLKLVKKHPEIASFTPLMKDSGWFEGKIWYLREYALGQMLGKDEDTFPYDPQVLSKLNPLEVAGFFYHLTKIPLEEVLSAIPNIRRYDLDWQSKEPKFLQNHPELALLQEKKLKFFKEDEQEKIFNLFINPPQAVFSPASWALNHANLSPTNLLFREPDLIVIDWENICWGFKAGDFSEFWYRSLTLPGFQEEFFQARLSFEEEKEDFKRIFYFALAVGTPGLLNYLNNLFQKDKIEKTIYETAVENFVRTVREGIRFLVG